MDQPLFLRVQDLLSDVSIDLVLVSTAAPEGVDRSKIDLDLLRHLEGITRAQGELVELINDPVDRVLGEDRSREVPGCLVAENERVGLDVDRHLPQGRSEGEGLALHERLVGELAKHSGIDHRSLTAQGRHTILHLPPEALDALQAKLLRIQVQLQQRRAPPDIHYRHVNSLPGPPRCGANALPTPSA